MTSLTTPASIPVSLRRQFPDASFVGCAEIAVTDATDRSSECSPGCLFAALPGANVHGRAFATEAVERGAVAVLVDAPLPEISIPQCILPDVRSAYARLCHTLYAWPTRRLGTVGVTGTNGKTSTAWLTRAILEHAGRRCGLTGTIEQYDGRLSTPAELTTPDPRTLARCLASTLHNGGRNAVMELSSHALQQERAAGVELDVAIVTNVTQDHFDYHGTFDAYRLAKAKIAKLLKRGGRLVLNADDPGSRSLLEHLPTSSQWNTFGVCESADVTASEVECSPEGCRFRLQAGVESVCCETALIGAHNISNCLAAASAALHFGLSLSDIADGIRAVTHVPGRLQRVEAGQTFQVFVDYAHTEDALRRAIAAVREITPGRLLCLFGAGGDRDRSKRARMGAAAAGADWVVVTSDNPRSEDPQAIIYDILSGCVSSHIHVDPDRERAIRWALDEARPGDSVLIAGKGHEKTQIIGRDRIPFDDAAVCRDHLSRLIPLPHFLSATAMRQPA
jgi:UDP-N-acetylmuramoyl-L-alanyl-D-glutamate--2,6-diaminopimelate ligase